MPSPSSSPPAGQADAESLKVSVVIPCLNEARTLGACIKKAQAAFRDAQLNGEVVVADNGSTDGSIGIAEGASNGENCELYFDWQGASIGVVAQVVWKNARGHAGLRFQRVDKESQARLNELCAQLSRQPHLALHHKEPQESHPAEPAHESKVARSAPPLAASHSPPVSRESDRSRRVVPRYVSELSGFLSNPTTGATINVTLVSLSISGAWLQGSPLPDAGQTCELQSEWDGKPFVLCCEVVWRTPGHAGVRFSSVDEETGKLLRRTLSNLRLEPPGHILS